LGNSDKSNRWLIVAHCFNMDGRAASQTITDRIPFLLNKGIEIVVLSAPSGNKDTRFPHYQVISPAPSGIRFEMRHVINKHFQNPVSKKTLKALLTITILPFLILEKLFIHLDSQWSWFISAVFKGINIIKEHKPDLIYTTAGPPSTHMAGYILKKIFLTPWLCELHDPLIYDDETPKWQNYYFKKILEKLIFKKALHVIYFSEAALKRAENRNPSEKGKAIVLRPGASPPKTQQPINYCKTDKIHFGHFGSLAEDRNLEVFFNKNNLNFYTFLHTIY